VFRDNGIRRPDILIILRAATTMLFFLAGIMQGSHRSADMHGQDYRGDLRQLVEQHFPEAKIYDPLTDHQHSLNYGDDRGRNVFLYHNKLCSEVDVLVAFVPEASMGTAIEMWEAYRHGKAVITISPLAHNWAVKFLSHALYSDMVAFREALASGEVRRRIEEVRKS